MRISDWSSDVCSSDLRRQARTGAGRQARQFASRGEKGREGRGAERGEGGRPKSSLLYSLPRSGDRDKEIGAITGWNRRSEERRVGKECVMTCRIRWSPSHYTKKKKYDHSIKQQ